MALTFRLRKGGEGRMAEVDVLAGLPDWTLLTINPFHSSPMSFRPKHFLTLLTNYVMVSHYIHVVSLQVLTVAVCMLNFKRSFYDERKAIQWDSNIPNVCVLSLYFWDDVFLVNGSTTNRHLLLHYTCFSPSNFVILVFQLSIMQQTARYCGI